MRKMRKERRERERERDRSAPTLKSERRTCLSDEQNSRLTDSDHRIGFRLYFRVGFQTYI